MMLKTLKLAGTALLAAATMAPTLASAQDYRGSTSYYAADYGRDGYGDGRGYARDGYRNYGDDRGPRHHHGRGAYHDRRDYRHCDHGTGGTILGAIAGGLLGNAAVGRRGDSTAGTLAGAGAGALIGRSIDRDC